MKEAPLIVFLSIVKKETIKSMIFFPVDYVNPLVGTLSKITLSTGNPPSLKIDGKEYNHNWLKHDGLLNGVVLDFDMNTSSSMQRGKNVKDFPYSLSNENK